MNAISTKSTSSPDVLHPVQTHHNYEVLAMNSARFPITPCSSQSLWSRLRPPRASTKRRRATGVCRELVEDLERRVMLSATTAAASANKSAALVTTAGYTGTIYHGVDYNPTWPNWSSTSSDQLSDSDFFDNAFAGLWGVVTGARAKHGAKAKNRTKGAKAVAKTTDTSGRNDLGTIAGAGLNEVRLYNWGPTRGWDGTKGTGHVNFLNYADSLGVKVMVPVSNYFVGDDQYSWAGKTPDATLSWDRRR